MSTRTTPHNPGQPTWVDLATSDLDGAKEFYHKLFGWEYKITGPDFGNYSFGQIDGNNAAGLGSVMPGSGMPPAWTVYFSTTDAAADVKRVQELGGQVMVEPMQIADSGSMAICVDPTGAAFGLWQPENYIGASVENQHGSMTWFEVNTPDADTARDFYGQLFNLSAEKMEEMAYYVMQQGGENVCGVLQMTEEWEGIPPHWMIYFQVDDINVACKSTTDAGGEVSVQPFDTPYGPVSVLRDPQGAAFMVVQMSS